VISLICSKIKFILAEVPYPELTLVWFIRSSYAYFAMSWQGIVTIIGLTVIHRNRWYANIPGIVVGNAIFMVFLLLIRDYVALII
jgi:hypothetical protein